VFRLMMENLNINQLNSLYNIFNTSYKDIILFKINNSSELRNYLKFNLKKENNKENNDNDNSQVLF
jgi:hypothetical protein